MTRWAWFAAIALIASMPVRAQQGTASGAAMVRAGCPTDDMVVFQRCALDKARSYEPPRTLDGRPDLQGVWNRWVNNYAVSAWPGNEFSSKQPSLVVDTSDRAVPYRPWAAAQVKANFAGHVDPNGLCLPPGSPRWFVITPGTEITQTRDHVVLYHMEAHTYRVIPMDGRPHLGSDIRLFSGDLRGRWEGNTLVIDVTNLDARGAWFTVMGDFASGAVRTSERLTRISDDTILVEVRVDDPVVFTQPWTMVTYLQQEPDEEILEESCHEGERFSKGEIESGRRTLFPGFTSRPEAK